MYEDLAKYFGGTTPNLGPSSKELAKFIVLNADFKTGTTPQKGASKPSIMSRIFDILSRPNYAVANFAKGIVEGNPNPLDILSGLAGQDKTTFSQVLDKAGMPKSPGRAGLGLLMDIGLDPTTYVGPGLIKGAAGAKGLTAAGKAEKEAIAIRAERPRQDVELPVSETPAPFRALPEMPQELPITVKPQEGMLDLPGIPKSIPPIEQAAPPVGKVAREVPLRQGTLNFPDFKVSEARKPAADIIEDLPANLEKVVPVPKPVPGPKHVVTADTILQSFKPLPTGVVGRNQMAKLYNEAVKLTRKTYKRPSRVRTSQDALKTYLAAEDKLRRQGFKPMGDVWLSDVIMKAGPEAAREFSSKIVNGSMTWQAVEDLRASAAIQDAGVIETISNKVAETHSLLEAGNQLSDAQLGRVKAMLQKIGKQTAKSQPITPSAEDAATQLVKMALQSGMSRAQIAVEQTKQMLDDIVATGKANPKANHVLTLALEKDLGKIPAWAETHNNAVEFLMGRVATWWGQKDLRPLSLNQIASSISTAAARGQALDHMFVGMNLAQRAEAFRLAQGVPGIPTSPDVHVVAQQVTRMMENLVGRAAGTSVITRSGVHMEMLNKWMKQYKVGFEFVQGKVKNHVTGVTYDLSKGADWLNTWKHVDLPGDCKSCIFKLQQAIEQATREKALFDELGERFGSTVPGKGYRTKIEGHPYLEGYYFTEDIAKQIPRVAKDWTTPGFQGGKGVLGLYDRVLSMWKAGVTIYRPGHHIRNMVGDVYLGWMDGVNSVRPYKLAAQVQRSMRELYSDLANVDKLVELGVMGRDMATPLPGKIIFTNKSGVGFTAEQIGAVAHQKGLLEHARTIEDIIDLGGNRGILDVKPFGGKVQRVARGASELQSHNARLAHFIDKVIKSRGSDLEDIFEQASRRARKWHPTGLDMTQFEKRVMRRIIPFYSWMRKSTPLLIEGLVMNPGKAVIPSKIYDAMQEAQGIDTPGRQDPFPVDQMFPEWIRQEGVGPVGLPGEGLLAKFSNQQPPGYTMAGMGMNPLTQMMAQFTDSGRTLTTSMTPALQIPLELATGKKLFTGEPITGPESRPGSFKQYVGEQIPIYGSLQNVIGLTPFGSETKAAAKSGGESQVEALTNWMTGAGIRGTGPYRSQARFEALAPGKMQKKVGREEFLALLRSRLGDT